MWSRYVRETLRSNRPRCSYRFRGPVETLSRIRDCLASLRKVEVSRARALIKNELSVREVLTYSRFKKKHASCAARFRLISGYRDYQIAKELSDPLRIVEASINVNLLVNDSSCVYIGIYIRTLDENINIH